jgi:hypothetical protein
MPGTGQREEKRAVLEPSEARAYAAQAAAKRADANRGPNPAADPAHQQHQDNYAANQKAVDDAAWKADPTGNAPSEALRATRRADAQSQK